MTRGCMLMNLNMCACLCTQSVITSTHHYRGSDWGFKGHIKYVVELCVGGVLCAFVGQHSSYSMRVQKCIPHVFALQQPSARA